ncbi:MAG TPA: ABC transporter permease [Methylomirabilota bacterium]|jgi:peptide/nickel transport system permease protein|nr:ABC transporter permease [Methylomirabilota bacterium]
MSEILRTPAGLAGGALTVALLLLAALAPVLAPADPFASVGAPLMPPSWSHALGTDDLGRDVYSAILHGTRTSLVVALGVVAIAATLGVFVGAVAGFRGGSVDELLMRGTEAVQIMPRFFLAVIVVALFGPGLDRVVLVLGLTTWPAIARVVRAETLSLARREFVDAAHALGATTGRVVVRHVLPNALPTALVVISLNAASVILLEAGLGFIGLGDPRAMSLGYLASNAQRFLRVAWWMAVFPGAAIALAVLALNLLGDALGDLANPRRPSRGRPA